MIFDPLIYFSIFSLRKFALLKGNKTCQEKQNSLVNMLVVPIIIVGGGFRKINMLL